jgi:putative pyoverdin transport system ATP-binding/permease protein
MLLLQLIRREIRSSLPKLVIMAMLAGASNALIIASINAAAEAATKGQLNFSSAIAFVLALLVYLKAQRYILATTTLEVEAAIHRMRLRLMNHVRHSELLPLEGIGKSEIVGAITKETLTLSQAATLIIIAAQGSVLILFAGFYIAYQSVPAFLISAVIVTIAAFIHLARNRQHRIQLRKSQESETLLLDRLTDLLDGFKEVRLNTPRSEALFRDIEDVSDKAAELKIKSHIDSLDQFVFSQVAFYVMIGGVVFVVPSFSDTAGASMVSITTALVFVIGAISSVVQCIPMLGAASAAADKITELEGMLQNVAGPPVQSAAPTRPFTTIELRDVSFRYADTRSDTVFRVGPVNLIVNAGEVVFIAGGNGSGKSTLLKVLTGLYPPDSGKILLDGEEIVTDNRDQYRERFTAIFSDYHLFKRFYGLMGTEPAEVQRLLTLFELTGKTHLDADEFSTIDLSAGQRKRLALIVGLLEKRPLLVLDEWTADQDPEFRRKFYDELIPALQKSGKTIVAVSHDDRYLRELKVPARQLRMEDGRFVAPTEART